MWAGDITVDHAYQISRLADRDVKAKKLTSLAAKPVHATETVLKEAESRDELNACVSEIRAEGYKAAVVSRYWSDPRPHGAAPTVGPRSGRSHGRALPCHCPQPGLAGVAYWGAAVVSGPEPPRAGR